MPSPTLDERAKTTVIKQAVSPTPRLAQGVEGMIRVNNRDEIAWEEGLTVAELLRRFRYTYPHIVVKVNGQVVYPEEYNTFQIPDNAEVWVIHLIAGG